MFEQLNLFQRLKGKNPLKTRAVPPGSRLELKNKDALVFIDHDVEIVRRRYQRTMNLLVHPNGKVRVTCARLTTKKNIVKFLSEHSVWLKKTLKSQEHIQNKFPPKRFIQGEEFLFMGGTVHLNFSPSTSKKISIAMCGDQLNVFVPLERWSEDFSQKPHPELRDSVLSFYKKTSKKLLESRFSYLSQKMNLRPTKISYRSQKTRWGSCNSKGHISINWRLIAAPVEVQEYVIIHELAHLQHQNHSQNFWSLVNDYCPNHKPCKDWLREHQFEFDFLSSTSELHQ